MQNGTFSTSALTLKALKGVSEGVAVALAQHFGTAAAMEAALEGQAGASDVELWSVGHCLDLQSVQTDASILG